MSNLVELGFRANRTYRRMKFKKNLAKHGHPGTISKLYLKSLLPDDATILEIGSHVGKDTEQLALLFPKGKIIGFEPDPYLFSEAVRRTRDLPNVELKPWAVSSSLSLNFFNGSSGEGNGSGSLLDPQLHLERHPGIKFPASKKKLVVTVSLDMVVANLDLEAVDLIWMDVQGAEGLVLSGGIDAFKMTAWVYSEVAEIPTYKHGISYEDLKDKMLTTGHEPYEEFMPKEWRGEGNVLFKNTLARSHPKSNPPS